MVRCSSCDEGKMVASRVQDYDASGIVDLNAVTVRTASVLVCDCCGHLMFEGRFLEAIMRELATLIVRQGGELLRAEVRFLREHFVMTQAELADRLGVTQAMVNRWEAGDDAVGVAQSFALRTLAARSLNDTVLARELRDSSQQAASPRSAPPYLLNGIMA